MPFLLLALACGKDATENPDDAGPAGELATLDGTITWNVDFGADSEAEGLADCSYTRTYAGVEDRSAPWLCAECEDLFLADVTLSAGQDCYATLSDNDPVPQEWIGYGDGVWYRAASSMLSERGPATREDGSLEVSQEVASGDSGGDYAFSIAGSFSIGSAAGDPTHGYTPPDSYACGWPKADPPAYDGDYLSTIGATLPDGVFTDLCDEPVRLHDFAGDYLVVDISAMDCGPCQSAADAEHRFVTSMENEGVTVRVVTLLAPSLSDTAGTPTHDELQQWVDAFDLEAPVLADRVWGLATTAVPLGEDFGYPTFLVVDPDLNILDIQVGFSDFDAISDTIRTDVGG